MASQTESQDLADEQSTSEDQADVGFVIAGVDGSEGAQRALAWALHKTDLLGPIKPVAAYHVESLGDGMGTPGLYQDLTELMSEDAKNRLTNALADHPELLARGAVVRGYPGPALVRAAEDQALLVVGSRGRSALAETLLGSVTSYCVKHSKVPVAVIPESTPTDEPLQHMVVGIDGSENATAAVRWALRYLAGSGGRITAVHSWLVSPYAVEMLPPTPSITEETKQAVAASVTRAVEAESEVTPGAADVAIEIKTVMGDARNVLPAEAEDADLLVVGSRGHRGATYLLLGSVTTSLIHHPMVATVVVPGG